MSVDTIIATQCAPSSPACDSGQMPRSVVMSTHKWTWEKRNENDIASLSQRKRKKLGCLYLEKNKFFVERNREIRKCIT